MAWCIYGAPLKDHGKRPRCEANGNQLNQSQFLSKNQELKAHITQLSRFWIFENSSMGWVVRDLTPIWGFLNGLAVDFIGNPMAAEAFSWHFQTCHLWTCRCQGRRLSLSCWTFLKRSSGPPDVCAPLSATALYGCREAVLF